MGLTSVDHFQPGWYTVRVIVTPGRLTTLSEACPNACRSSGVSMFLTATIGSVASSIRCCLPHGLAGQASMQAGRLPSHREQHVDASGDYVVPGGGNVG